MILPILLILVALVVERGVTLWSVSEQVAQSRTQAEKQFLTLFPEQKRIVNLRSQVTMALKNIAHRLMIPICLPSCLRSPVP